MIDQSGSTNRSAADSETDDPLDSQRYMGETLGLPESGRGSLASMVRRVGAIFIDWFMCMFIVLALIRPSQTDVGLWTLLIFGIQDFLLTSLTGLTIGKRLVGIRVVRLDGRWIGPVWGLLRTVLLLLIVPALFMNADQRGLQDRAANTVVVRL
ncbi:MAG TPA: RDD family protein [Streptosporangiaceae bacterium]|nr:RDD family protein [Streptosporangiaceae bacterium]